MEASPSNLMLNHMPAKPRLKWLRVLIVKLPSFFLINRCVTLYARILEAPLIASEKEANMYDLDKDSSLLISLIVFRK